MTLTRTKNFQCYSTKGSLEKMRSEMAKMDSELKEVKEKLCTLATPVGESKNEGQLNYTIKVILLNRKFSRGKHVLCVREIILS